MKRVEKGIYEKGVKGKGQCKERVRGINIYS